MLNNDPMWSHCSEMFINYGILFSGISINIEDKETKPTVQHIQNMKFLTNHTIKHKFDAHTYVSNLCRHIQCMRVIDNPKHMGEWTVGTLVGIGFGGTVAKRVDRYITGNDFR